jgi:hypothetical protein
MPEGMNTNPIDPNLGDAERLADYLARHPEPVVAPETSVEVASEIEKFESLVGVFESKYSLAELNSIIDLTPQEAPNHPLREPARIALILIVGALNNLKNSIPKEQHEALKAKYKKLSRAVGIINSGKVDHNR